MRSQSRPALDTEPHPIHISSPGACFVLSSRSTVFVLSAMKYWVFESIKLSCVNIKALPAAIPAIPYHCSLCSCAMADELAESRQSRIWRGYLRGSDVRGNIDILYRQCILYRLCVVLARKAGIRVYWCTWLIISASIHTSVKVLAGVLVSCKVVLV